MTLTSNVANRQIPAVKAHDVENIPKTEFAFPIAERDRLVAAILDGQKLLQPGCGKVHPRSWNHSPASTDEQFWLTQMTSQLPSLDMPKWR